MCRSRFLKVDLFPLAANDALPDLGGTPAPLGFVVAVVELLQARRAISRMSRFKAGMEAVVPDAVAVAVTGLLIYDVGDLGREFVRPRLIALLEIDSPKRVLWQDRRNERTLPGWGRIICRNSRRALGIALAEKKQAGQKQESDSEGLVNVLPHFVFNPRPFRIGWQGPQSSAATTNGRPASSKMLRVMAKIPFADTALSNRGMTW